MGAFLALLICIATAASAGEFNPILTDPAAVLQKAMDLEAPLPVRRASRRFLRSSGPQGEAVLLEALQEGTMLQRQVAVRILGAGGSAAAGTALEAALEDSNPLVRSHARHAYARWLRQHRTGGELLDALSGPGAPSVPAARALLRALAETEPACLQRSEDVAVVETVATRLPAVRPLVACCLGMAADNAASAAAEVLVRWAGPEAPTELRIASLYALGQLGRGLERLKTAHEATPALVRIEAAGALVRMGRHEALPTLLAPLTAGEKPPEVADRRRAAAAALVGRAHGAGVRLPFGGAVASDRLRALKLLQEIAPPGAEDALHEALASPSWRVRALAAEALGALKGPAMDPALRQALADPKAQVRTAVAKALHARGARALKWRFIRALEDPDAQVRIEAAETLACILDEAAINPLARALTDPSVSVSVVAARSLGAFVPDPVAAAALVDHMADSRDAVALQAATALATGTDLPFAADPTAALTEWHATR